MQKMINHTVHFTWMEKQKRILFGLFEYRIHAWRSTIALNLIGLILMLSPLTPNAKLNPFRTAADRFAGVYFSWIV